MSERTEMLDRIVAQEGEAPPFVGKLGMPWLTGWEPGRAWLEWKVDPELFHLEGALFGGFIAALADHALGFPAMSVLDDGENMTTSDLRVSFFRPVTEGTLHIESRVVHRGRRMIHVEASFTRDDGKLAAVATATQVIVEPTNGRRG
jgi:uncharacterized protein (TIGR00369 family)